VTDLERAWAELSALRPNDLRGAAAWVARWRHVLAADDGLTSALLRLFEDPAPVAELLPRTP
jgi:hypothetical protein